MQIEEEEEEEEAAWRTSETAGHASRAWRRRDYGRPDTGNSRPIISEEEEEPEEEEPEEGGVGGRGAEGRRSRTKDTRSRTKDTRRKITKKWAEFYDKISRKWKTRLAANRKKRPWPFLAEQKATKISEN